MAQLIPMLLQELEQEAITTRKMLERVPADKFSWQPHPKSMTLVRLATHVAELPAWTSMAINTEELDFAANPYSPVPIADTASLLEYFDNNLIGAKDDLAKTTEEHLDESWTLRNGDKVYVVRPKHGVIRMAYCQTVHHRAQLGVYLRLLNIPIPGSYGPSADEGEM